ncbi:hypothetical protein LINGRAHAP2_LOCUS5737, partial [Linum grandiflorum]
MERKIDALESSAVRVQGDLCLQHPHPSSCSFLALLGIVPFPQ